MNETVDVFGFSLEDFWFLHGILGLGIDLGSDSGRGRRSSVQRFQQAMQNLVGLLLSLAELSNLVHIDVNFDG